MNDVERDQSGGSIRARARDVSSCLILSHQAPGTRSARLSYPLVKGEPAGNAGIPLGGVRRIVRGGLGRPGLSTRAGGKAVPLYMG